ncbi:MAG: serine/threonine protein kinase [Thermomicrobiales bacterium]
MDEDRNLQAPSQLVVANRYAVDLDSLIGAGGMALVYRGRDLRTRRDVALKTLRLEYRRDPDTRARFRREVRTLAFLTHPNVVKIFDLYEDDEAPWAIMEFIDGVSLKEIVRAQGRLSLEDTSSVLDQIAGALQHLHEQGLVHLDVKPQNVIVQADGLAKLIDFGLAQPAHTPQELIGGSTFGTVSYLAPEQASGEPVDVHTDVYALGCVVYEMLTGRAPFDGEDGEIRHDTVRAHLQDDPLPPSSIEPRGTLPPSIDPIVLGALAKRPNDRYRDTVTFSTLFRNAVDDAAEERTSRKGVAGAFDVPPIEVKTKPTWRHVQVEEAPRKLPTPFLLRTARLRRVTWRLLAVVLFFNLIVGTLVIVDRGELPPFTSRPGQLEQGVVARVRVDQLNVRAAPGNSAQVIRSVRFGIRAEVTGASMTADGSIWWPIVFEINGEQTSGYVWSGGIEPAGTGFAGDVQREVDDIRRSIGETLGWTP